MRSAISTPTSSSSSLTSVPTTIILRNAEPPSGPIIDYELVVRARDHTMQAVRAMGNPYAVDRYCNFNAAQLANLGDLLRSHPQYQYEDHRLWSHDVFFERLEALISNRQPQDIISALQGIPFVTGLGAVPIQRTMTEIRQSILQATGTAAENASLPEQERWVRILVENWRRTPMSGGYPIDFLRKAMRALSEAVHRGEVHTIEDLGAFFWTQSNKVKASIQTFKSVVSLTEELELSIDAGFGGQPIGPYGSALDPVHAPSERATSSNTTALGHLGTRSGPVPQDQTQSMRSSGQRDPKVKYNPCGGCGRRHYGGRQECRWAPGGPDPHADFNPQGTWSESPDGLAYQALGYEGLTKTLTLNRERTGFLSRTPPTSRAPTGPYGPNPPGVAPSSTDTVSNVPMICNLTNHVPKGDTY